MKKILSISLLVLFLSSAMSARPAWERFVAAAGDAMVSFSCSYTVHSKPAVSGNASADVQDGKFRIKNGDIEVICNGALRWTVDSTAQEIVIEPADGGLEANPAIAVCEMDRYFRPLSTSAESIHGETFEKTVFTPVSDASGISSMSITFKDRGEKPPVMVRASVKMKDDTVTDFTFTRMTFMPKMKDGYWTCDTAGTGSSWIITDLR